MKLSKAVITAAGPNQNRLPLQRFVDLDGIEKTALQIIIEEVIAAGIQEIAVVLQPGDDDAYADAAGDYAQMLTFVEQPEPRGYGEALYRAAKFVRDEPFVHLVSDHLYISGESRRCTQQLVEVACREMCPVSAVQATRENMLPYYGTIGGRRVEGRSDLYVVENVLEKPTPTEAEQRLMVPGLRGPLPLSVRHARTQPCRAADSRRNGRSFGGSFHRPLSCLADAGDSRTLSRHGAERHAV